MKILFLGKEGDKNAEEAAQYTKQLFPQTKIVWARRGVKFPKDLKFWSGDYVFSYLCPWIIPEDLLNKAKKAAINWHPGPPEYPGIGCTNFAMYNEEKVFGITCHHMNPKVDTGNIIEVRRFNVMPEETVWSMTQKCYSHILSSYYDILEKIALGQALPDAGEDWTREPYKRKELNALCQIDPNAAPEEIERRIKATKFDKHWAYIMVNGRKFYLLDDED